MTIQEKKRMVQVLEAGILTALCLIILLPIYITVINAFKGTDEILFSPLALPNPVRWDNFRTIMDNKYVRIDEMYHNSFALTVIGTIASLMITSTAAYYLARSKRKIASILRLYFMLGLLVPYVIVYQPLCIVMRELHIPFNVVSLCFVFVSCNISFPIFIYTNFITTLPVELEEAAAIDGATNMQVFCRIVFPLLKPCTATVMIFVAMGIWNDFQTPMLMGQINTITVGIYTAVGPYSADWGILFAYVALATVPIIILYLTAQKHFVDGMTAGAVKG